MSNEALNIDNKDSQLNDSNWLDLYWNYFELLSNQRMQMMNFYITIEVVLIGAWFAIINTGNCETWIKYACLFGIMLIAILFFALDRRTRYMIHCCEESIKKMEQLYFEGNNRSKFLFHSIDSKKSFFTYSKIFGFMHIIVLIIGIIGIIFISKNVI